MTLMLSIICFTALAGFLVWYLIHFDRGQTEPWRAIALAIGLGGVGFGLAFAAEKYGLAHLPLSLDDFGSVTVISVLILSTGVAAIEELAKFGPLALAVRGRAWFNEHTDGVFYFAICGMAFGLAEDIEYAVQLHGGVALLRIVVGGFFHGATTGIVGYYYARARLDHRSQMKTGAALLLMIAVHAVFDFGLLYGSMVSVGLYSAAALGFVVLSLMMVPLVNVGLFLYYMRANEHDVAAGLASAMSVQAPAPAAAKRLLSSETPTAADSLPPA